MNLSTVDALPPADPFADLVLAQLDTLYRVARRLVADPNTADDLVQETYAKAFTARDSFVLREWGVKPWLVRILHNVHVTRATRRKPFPALADEMEPPAPQDGWPGCGRGQGGALESMDDRITAALHDLAPDCRLAVLLWAVEGLTYAEIAQALGVPIGTVMSRLHRARHRLADVLSPVARELRWVS